MIIRQLREEEALGIIKTNSMVSYKESESIENRDYEKTTTNNAPINHSKKSQEKNNGLGNVKTRYQTIFENYSVAITLADNKERIVSWNSYAEEMLNKNEKDLYLAPVSSLYSSEEWQRIRSENVRQKGIKYRMETKMLRKDKEPLDVELSLCILKSIDGKIVGSVGIIKDISKLKIAERKLKESENKYRTIFDNSAVAITVSDENERIVSWNNFAEILLEMNKEDLFMKPVKSLYPEEDWAKIRSENIRQKGMKHCIETRMVKKNNETISVCLSLSVIKNYKDKIIGSIGVIQDNSKQKKMETYLKKSEKKFRQLYENAPIPYHTLNPNGIITNVNKKWCQILGYLANEVIGKSIFNFINNTDKESAKSSFIKKINDGESYTELSEREFLTKSGEKRIFLMHDFQYFDNTGNLEFIQTTMEDITERTKNDEKLKESYDIIRCVNKDLERKVKERTNEIENLLKQKDEFINQLGHDLKTPLTPLVSLLPIMENTEDDPKSKEMLEVFHRNVDYMKNLVTKTIELARLNSSNTVFDYKDINLRDVIENCIKDQLIICDNKNIKINNEVEKTIIVKADRLRLGELFNNIFNNSLKYTPIEGTIIVNTTNDEDFVTVSIKDSGIGMNEEQLGKIFNEFYKADKSRHDFRSSGLGLSICRRIVEKHGGKIWAESPGLGKGSTFYLTLLKKH